MSWGIGLLCLSKQFSRHKWALSNRTFVYKDVTPMVIKTESSGTAKSLIYKMKSLVSLT